MISEKESTRYTNNNMLEGTVEEREILKAEIEEAL